MHAMGGASMTLQSFYWMQTSYIAVYFAGSDKKKPADHIGIGLCKQNQHLQ